MDINFRQHRNSDRSRLRIPLFLIAVIMFGLILPSGTQAYGPPFVAPSEDNGQGATIPDAVRNELMATRLFDEVFTQRKADVCALIMDASATTHTPAGDFNGPGGFEQYVAEIWADFPDAIFAIHDGFADGDNMTVQWTMSHLGPDGQAITLEGVAILRFENHMIAETWIHYDRLSLLEQLESAQSPADSRICPPCAEP